jgi:hypothetical protein
LIWDREEGSLLNELKVRLVNKWRLDSEEEVKRVGVEREEVESEDEARVGREDDSEIGVVKVLTIGCLRETDGLVYLVVETVAESEREDAELLALISDLILIEWLEGEIKCTLSLYVLLMLLLMLELTLVPILGAKLRYEWDNGILNNGLVFESL